MIHIKSKSKLLARILRLVYRRKIKGFNYQFGMEVVDPSILDGSLYRQYADDLEEDVTEFIALLRKEAEDIEQNRRNPVSSP